MTMIRKGVLPYVGFIGMCGPKDIAFWLFWSEIGNRFWPFWIWFVHSS